MQSLATYALSHESTTAADARRVADHCESLTAAWLARKGARGPDGAFTLTRGNRRATLADQKW